MRMSIALLIVAVAAPLPVAAQLPPARQRTVAWYVANPQERLAVRRACLNDPGHLEDFPDCRNAARAEQHTARATPPHQTRPARSMVEHWTTRPNDRALKLRYCSYLTPSQQAVSDDCATARQSLVMAQRQASR